MSCPSKYKNGFNKVKQMWKKRKLNNNKKTHLPSPKQTYLNETKPNQQQKWKVHSFD